jgi:serine/threonine protein kinase/tetratricopeptide (TPR) repeat protein
MTPERWQQLKRIFQSALERNPAERSAFLSQACADDAALRSEVESLISSHDQAGDSIEAMAVEAATEMLSTNQTDSIVGKQIGHYQVLTLIGRGGMGEVFLAQDMDLGRKVALKLLRTEFTRNEERLRRFRQEARAASSLNHPNILTIHEIGQADTLHFMATEYVEGETLRQHISRARMTLGQVLDVATQVASALAAAHQAGIIHRDIKPENIMLRSDGYVKVLDFGLAKLAESKAIDTTLPKVETQPGLVMGTVSYMSPEQARGLAVDARTDIWSLGVMIYEMAAGRQPFEGETASDVMSLILQKEPPPLTLSLPEVPGELERIVRKALRKDKEERYQTIKDLLIDLRNLRKELELEAEMERSATPMVGHPTSAQSAAATAHSMSSAEYIVTEIKQHKRSAALILGMVIVSAILLLSLLFRQSPSTKEASPRNTSLAVLPFKPIGGEEDEYLGLGMADALITKLSKIREINVRPTSAVRKYGAQDQDPVAAGRELRVEAVIEGSVQRVGDRIRVTVQLVSVRDGAPLWAETFDENFTNIFAVQDRISEQVAQSLTLTLNTAERELLTKRYTENSEAYQLYLKGRYFWNKRTGEGMKRGIEYFDQAIRIDPNYALAHAGLADSYNVLGQFGELAPDEAMPRAKAAALRALEIDDTLAEAHASLAMVYEVYEWDWAGAETQFKRAIELNPNYANAHHWYAMFLSAAGRHDEALAEIRRAKEIDPVSLIVSTNEGWILFCARQYDSAIEQLQKSIEMDPSFANAHYKLALVYEAKGMYKEAVEEFLKHEPLSGTSQEKVATLRAAYSESGWEGFCQQQLERLKKAATEGYVSPKYFVLTYLQLGEKDRAFEWLEKAYQERGEVLLYLKVDPRFDPLRSDPRFSDLLRRVELAE